MDSKKLKSLQDFSRKIFEKNKDIIFDIVLFGSSIKGKAKPADIDIAVVFKKKIGQERINKIFEGLGQFHMEYVFLEELYKETLWPTILQEGYSLLQSKHVYKMLGFDSMFLFVYDLKKLNNSNKSRFSHALFGKKKRDGLLFEMKGKQLGRGCIAIGTENSERMRSFFETWNVSYSVYRALLH